MKALINEASALVIDTEQDDRFRVEFTMVYADEILTRHRSGFKDLTVSLVIAHRTPNVVESTIIEAGHPDLLQIREDPIGIQFVTC